MGYIMIFSDMNIAYADQIPSPFYFTFFSFYSLANIFSAFT